MRITAEQLGGFACARREAFERRLAARLAANFGASFAREGSALAFARAAVEHALARGVRSCRAVASYASLRAILGEGFETDPSYPWALPTLDDAGLGPLDVRVGVLVGEAYASMTGTPGARSQLHWAAREALSGVDDPVVAHEGLVALRVLSRDPRSAAGDRAIRVAGAEDAPGDHWVISMGPGNVTLEAETYPHDASVWRRLKWSGGAPVDGAPSRRCVDRTRPGRHRVLVTLGSETAAIDVWTVFAHAEVRSAEGETQATPLRSDGKALFVARIEPTSVARFVRTGWRIRHGVRGSSSRPVGTPVTPDRNGEIQATIGPGGDLRSPDSAEQRLWLAWNDLPCSESIPWRFAVRDP